MIAAARAWWLRVRLKRACNVIRSEAGRCGVDLSKATNAQLVERGNFAGLPPSEKCDAMDVAADAWRQLNRGFAALGAAQRARGEMIDAEPDQADTICDLIQSMRRPTP